MTVRLRDKAATRKSLLESGFEEIYSKGFESASINRIVKNARSSKGAFFNIFPTKKSFGEAILKEVIYQSILDVWIDPIRNSNSPLDTLKEVFKTRVTNLSKRISNKELAIGCPLNNFVMEATRYDREVIHHCEKIYDEWLSAIIFALNSEYPEMPTKKTEGKAQFLLAMIIGTFSIARTMTHPKLLKNNYQQFANYIDEMAIESPKPAPHL